MASGTGALESTQQSVLSALQGGGLGGGAVTVADGADAAQGTTTDAAGASTLVGQSKQINTNTTGLAKESGGNLASIKADADSIVTNTSNTATNTSTTATNTSNINTHAASIDTAAAAAKADLDIIVTQTATPNVSDRWARQVGQVDIARVLGAALSQSNPIITESNIQNWVRNGQAFVANGRGLTATNANLLNCALSIFNPLASGKNILIYSLRCMTSSSGGTISQWNLTTSDPFNTTGFTTVVTPIHLPGATSPSTVVSACQTATGNTTTVAAPGTKAEEFLLTSSVSTEILSNNASILLTPGNGIAIMMFVGTTGNYYQSFAKWIEY